MDGLNKQRLKVVEHERQDLNNYNNFFLLTDSLGALVLAQEQTLHFASTLKCLLKPQLTTNGWSTVK